VTVWRGALSLKTRRSRSIAHLLHRATFHTIAAVSPRLVHRYVHLPCGAGRPATLPSSLGENATSTSRIHGWSMAGTTPANYGCATRPLCAAGYAASSSAPVGPHGGPGISPNCAGIRGASPACRGAPNRSDASLPTTTPRRRVNVQRARWRLDYGYLINTTIVTMAK
jgi:hypothetical protein